MSGMKFFKATKRQAKLRMALDGPSGAGKTFSALSIGTNLGSKVAVIDTEKGSASKYAGQFEFDVLELSDFHPKQYVEAIDAAEQAGYDVLIIDSLSHSWFGKNGALDLADQEAKRSKSGNSFQAWKTVTPIYNAMIERILHANMHVFGTMRTKTEYVVEKNERGQSVPRKVGMQPIGREGMEFEFDVVADMDLDNNLIITKTRCSALSGKLFNKPGKEVADILSSWLSDGSPVLFEEIMGDMTSAKDKAALEATKDKIKNNMASLSEKEVNALRTRFTELSAGMK